MTSCGMYGIVGSLRIGIVRIIINMRICKNEYSWNNRPDDVPDVWRKDDFYMKRIDWEFYNRTVPRNSVRDLCANLDFINGGDFPGTHGYYRKKILRLFKHDLLHACEIIDAYGLSH